jgi:hypothetical protein
MAITAEQCRKYFEDVVEDLSVPLSFILKYVPYRKALLRLSSEVQPTITLKSWMKTNEAFDLFKVTLVAQGNNIKGLYFEDWLECVANNESVLYWVDDWRSGGALEISDCQFV